MIAGSSQVASVTKTQTGDRGGAAMPLAAEWREWWREWGPKIAKEVGRQGWVLFILDANEKLLEVQTIMARIIRKGSEWDSTGFQEDEWLNVADVAGKALGWFEANAPSPRDVPEWARFLLAAQHGNFAVCKRLASELRTLQEQGYSVVTLEHKDGGIQVGGDPNVIVREMVE